MRRKKLVKEIGKKPSHRSDGGRADPEAEVVRAALLFP
jgi:hypothetical protein